MMRPCRAVSVRSLMLTLAIISAPAGSIAAEIGTLRSRNLVVHTDLPAADAQAMMAEVEVMYRLLEQYFAQRCRGPIQCYLVNDLDGWPQGTFPPVALVKLQARAGVTLTTTAFSGNKIKGAESIVYSNAALDTFKHECVHAFCGQSFGRTGPTWYSEGVAELGSYWKDGRTDVTASPVVIDYLSKSSPRELLEIVHEEEAGTWRDYAWRWMICHLLEHNPTYHDRFRLLGAAILRGDDDATFESAFGPMASELQFEYTLLHQHLAPGYRVDLCAWPWNAKFRALGRRPITARIEAKRGWQASSARLVAGKTYSYRATGKWFVAEDGESLSADGGDEDRGRLYGVVMHEYALSDPFPLGAEGTFESPADGQLYLRCHDDWAELPGNKGRVTVRLEMASGTDERAATR